MSIKMYMCAYKCIENLLGNVCVNFAVTKIKNSNYNKWTLFISFSYVFEILCKILQIYFLYKHRLAVYVGTSIFNGICCVVHIYLTFFNFFFQNWNAKKAKTFLFAYACVWTVFFLTLFCTQFQNLGKRDTFIMSLYCINTIEWAYNFLLFFFLI